MSNIRKQFGDMLKDMRFKWGIDQISMSKELGVSQGTLSKLENGKLDPRLSVLCAIRNKYGINTLSKLIGDI
jgi:predicted transcriptional regulator